MFEKDSIELLQAESSHTFPLHSHECVCLGVVNGGKVKFQIGDQEKVLEKGMNFLIPSNVGVTITALQRYAYTTICFKADKKEYLMNYDYEDYFPNISKEGTIMSLCEKFKADGDSEYYMNQMVSILRPYMLEKKKKSEEVYDEIEKAKEYIRKHIYEHFNLDELAEYIHMSKYHFIRKFKKETGVTPNQYYIQAKLFAAKNALKQNEKETDVAANLNYTDQSYLCNVFKKQMGISMKEFKSNYEKK